VRAWSRSCARRWKHTRTWVWQCAVLVSQNGRTPLSFLPPPFPGVPLTHFLFDPAPRRRTPFLLPTHLPLPLCLASSASSSASPCHPLGVDKVQTKNPKASVQNGCRQPSVVNRCACTPSAPAMRTLWASGVLCDVSHTCVCRHCRAGVQLAGRERAGAVGAGAWGARGQRGAQAAGVPPDAGRCGIRIVSCGHLHVRACSMCEQCVRVCMCVLSVCCVCDACPAAARAPVAA